MTSQAPARTGRRPGHHETRADILDAARRSFGQNGYAGTTVRQVAARAGVDAAMVHRHFGTKQRLLLEAIGLPDSLDDVLALIVSGSPATMGERVVRGFVQLWDAAPARGASFPGLLQLAAASPDAAQALKDYLTHTIGTALSRVLGRPLSDRTLGLIGSQLLGIAVARYLICLPPVASATPSQLAADSGWIIQRLIAGPPGPCPHTTTGRSA